MRFGSDSPDIAEAVQASRRRARTIQSWIDRLLGVPPPDNNPKDEDAKSRRNQILP